MKLCQECSEELSSNARRCACGWRSAEASKAPVDLLRWTCCHLNRGMRCAESGTLTFNGCGPEGPKAWYCHRHFPPLAGLRGPRTPPPQSFVGLRQALGRALQLDPESAAERAAIEAEA